MPATLEKLYPEVERLLWDTVHKFHRRHGGDLDELHAEANYWLVRCYQSFDARGAFSTWMTSSIWWGLMKVNVRRAKHHRRYGMPLPEQLPAKVGEFDPLAFVEGLSEEARLVARLAIDPPKDIRTEANGAWGRVNKGEDIGKSMKRAIKKYLADIGWCTERIEAAFAEIGAAL